MAQKEFNYQFGSAKIKVIVEVSDAISEALGDKAYDDVLKEVMAPPMFSVKGNGGALTPLGPDRSEYDKHTSTKHHSVCLQRAGDDEPIFVLRAKDPTAPEVVEEWCSKNNDLQPIEKIGGAMILADKMREWRNENIKE